MGQRLDLHDKLLELCPNVYFQPPPSENMLYDCIVYNRSFIDIRFADNTPYKNKVRYQLTVISSDPDSDLPMKVANLPMCSYDRFFVADDLNHDVFRIFF